MYGIECSKLSLGKIIYYSKDIFMLVLMKWLGDILQHALRLMIYVYCPNGFYIYIINNIKK